MIRALQRSLQIRCAASMALLLACIAWASPHWLGWVDEEVAKTRTRNEEWSWSEACIERNKNQTHTKFRSVVKNMKYSQKNPQNQTTQFPPPKKSVGKTIRKHKMWPSTPHPGWLTCHTGSSTFQGSNLETARQVGGDCWFGWHHVPGWSIIGGRTFGACAFLGGWRAGSRYLV